MLPVVMRIVWPPSTLATQRSSSPERPPRKAIFDPSFEMAQEVVSIVDGCLTRRWIPSQSKSFDDVEPALVSART